MPSLVVDRRSFLAGAAAASMLLPGATAAQQRVKVKYLTPFGYLIGFGETMYADTGGFFAKEGLDVEIEGGRGSAMSVQQVMGGNVLLSRTGGTDHIKAYAKDPSIVAIGEIFQRDIFYVISHADKPIRSTADLAGKTMGVVSPGGATENLLDMMLTSAGIPTTQTERQAVGNAPSAFELVKLGRVAGYIATSDTVFQLRSDKQPVVAWSTDDAAPCPGQVYMTSRASLDKNGDQLAKFFRAVHACLGALIQAESNLGPVVDSMLTKYDVFEAKRPDKGVPVLKNSLQHTFAAPYRDKLRSSPTRWNSAYELMVKTKIIGPLDKREFYDDSVVKAAFG
jgi:ABC-type nitrate/sulfonate/bicarbonate transport system substrate-binding protein